ncbi:MAG: hypothetical protein L6Q37_07285 [Bdellovibrionaceae bacterium]|nr:hypothetical protein [Pseudobdellovibrionaceae bacterium]NUM59127.1 hypothetical protein [Pseudobdellovibrionaceae bacterium]
MISVLGSIHGNMLDQPRNSIRDFVAALHLFQPTLILSEVRPEAPDSIEGAIDGAPEQILVYAYAKSVGARVIPVNWVNDQYNKEAAKENSQQSTELKSKIEPLFLMFREVVQHGTFLESQSALTQEIIRKRYDILDSHGFTALRKRSQAICGNIRSKAAQFTNQRVLIVFGLAHKYILEDCIRDLGMTTSSVETWFDLERSKQTKFDANLKVEAAQSFRAAKSLLLKRLQSGYYTTDIEEQRETLKDFDVWLQQTSTL